MLEHTHIHTHNLNPLSSTSLFHICVVPTLLYGSENWILTKQTIAIFQSQMGKRILKIPKHYASSLPIVARVSVSHVYTTTTASLVPTNHHHLTCVPTPLPPHLFTHLACSPSHLHHLACSPTHLHTPPPAPSVHPHRLGEAVSGPPVPWWGHQSCGTKPALSGWSSMFHHSAEVARSGGLTAHDLGDTDRLSGGHWKWH